jgi:hypothetical protein
MKKFVGILIVGISLLLLFYRFYLPPIKYWFTSPANFEECKEYSRGLIVLTKPAQCEYGGNTFIDGKNPLAHPLRP